VSLPFDVVRGLRRLIESSTDPRSDVRVMLRALRDTLRTSWRLVSDTPINRPISPHRRVEWTAMSLDDVKVVKRALGGTLNDIVLATVTGGVQRYLEARRVNVDVLDFRVMAPVSVRSESERGTLGNRVSAWILELPLAERDPRRRLARICERTSQLKETKQAMGAEALTRAAEWTPSTLMSLGARMMMRALPFNIVVTNVPGPQVPLYMLGARMVDNYGHIPLVDYLGVGIVLFSYAGTLCWGFTGDWDLVPDLHVLVESVQDAFAELRAAAGIAPVAFVAPRSQHSQPTA